MKCPNCSFDNPEGIRFCGQCATELSLACPNCQFRNPANFQFCGQCATPLSAELRAKSSSQVSAEAVRDLADKILDSSRQLEGERRNLTVLFVDLSSFTQLAEQLDPEDVYVAVDLYLRETVDQVSKFGGHVDKFTGDGLMALFGAPVAHENDPERALRAALGIQNSLTRLSEVNAWSAPIALNVRIGLNSGPVVVGRVGAEVNYTAMGDVVNVASRLENLADPGSILVSQNVYEVNSALFNFRRIGPVTVRGRQEPVEVYQLLGERGDSPAGHRHGRAHTPLVGRQQELEALQAVTNQLVEQGRGGFVMITGEAGIGKTRLIAEVHDRLNLERVNWLTGSAISYGATSAYQVFGPVLRQLFGLGQGLGAEEMRRTIKQELYQLEPGLLMMAQPYLEQLFGVPLSDRDARRLSLLDPQQLRQQTFLAVRAVLAAASARRPLVLVLEDLHWIDELSLELLIFILNSVADSPLLLLGVLRQTDSFSADRLDKVAAVQIPDCYHRIQLQPLSTSENVALIEVLLGVKEVPASVSQAVVEMTAGNPFFTEEMVGVLIDKGVFFWSGDHLMTSPAANQPIVDIPANLDRLIMSRVDSMGASVRHMLQCASVVGQRFSVPLLAVLLKEEPSRLDTLLELATNRGFVSRAGQDEAASYDFRHGLMRDTVYNSLLFRHRRQLHRQTAEALEAAADGSLPLDPALLSHHYTNSDTPERAVPYLIQAGHKARQRFANQEAIAFYQQALELQKLLPELAPQMATAIYTGLGEAQALVGATDLAVEAYQEALAALAREPVPASSRQTGDLQRHLGRVYERRGDYDEALTWLDASLATLEGSDEPDIEVSRALVFNDKGWLVFRQGKVEEAHQWLMQALPILEQSDEMAELASAYNRLVGICVHTGALQEALAYGEKGLLLRQELGDTYGLSRSFINLGTLAIILGEWNQAREYLEQGLSLCETTGWAEGVVAAKLNLAYILHARGQLSQAEAHLQSALRQARSIANLGQVALILVKLGELSIWQEEAGAAVAYLEEARLLAERSGALDTQAEAEWRMAWAYLELGRTVETENWVRQAQELAGKTNAQEPLAGALRIAGMLHAGADRLDEAEACLSQSVDVFQRSGNLFETARSQVELGLLLARLETRQGDAVLALQEAAATFSRLGAGPSEEQVVDRLRHLSVSSPASTP